MAGGVKPALSERHGAKEQPLIAIPFLLLSVVGTGYTLHAAIVVERFRRRPSPPSVAPEPVSLLKPLHGVEPRLRDNLSTFLDQRWEAPIELVAGMQQANDPAGEVAAGLRQSSFGHDRSVTLVRDATPHGANAKIANLINMAPAASHDLIVLSDSDIAVPRDYLTHLAATLAQPGVGAVTCLYRGRGDAGVWSVLAAGAISYQFMPSILVALSFGHPVPTMGSTIALRRETLERIGGFAPFADVLADDNAIGYSVNARGLVIALPTMVLAHGCTEMSFGAVVRHELRWSATIRSVSRIGHAGLVSTFPVAFALLALPFHLHLGAAALAMALAARFVLLGRVDHLVERSSAPLWMLVPRDCLSFAIWFAALFVRSVEWQGRQLAMRRNGRVAQVSR